MDNVIDLSDVVDSENETLLYKAVSNGHINVIQFLIDSKIVPKYRDKEYHYKNYRKYRNRNEGTLLEMALRKKQFEMAASLITNGFSPNDYRERDIIYATASQGDVEAIKFLLDHGIDVDNMYDIDVDKMYCRSTMLHMAVENGHFEVVKLLIDKQAHLNFADSMNRKPLYIAVKNGHFEIVKLLIEKKADLNVIDSYKKTLLHIAVEAGHFEIVKLLIEKKADLSAVDSHERTPLHLAIEKGCPDIVKFLLDKGALIDEETRIKAAGIKRFFIEGEENSHEEINRIITEKIIDNHVKSYASMCFKNENNRHLFTEEAKAIYAEIRTNVSNEAQEISSACQTAYVKAAALIIADAAKNLPVEIQQLFINLAKPLSEKYFASAHASLTDTKIWIEKIKPRGFEEAVVQRAQYFAKNFADYLKNKAYFNIATPLHEVARNGDIESMKYLLENNMDIETKNDEGDTALHIAAKYGQVAMVRFLLKHDANIEAVDKRGNTPLHFIRGYLELNFNIELRNEYKTIMSLLLEHPFNDEKEWITKLAGDFFEDEKNQSYFIKRVKILSQTHGHPVLQAVKKAYVETSDLIIQGTAKQLPHKKRKDFVQYTKKCASQRWNLIHRDWKLSFETEVVRDAYVTMKFDEMNRLIDKSKQSISARYQVEFVNMVKKNILKNPDWKNDKDLWVDEIINARKLIAEKRKLIHFLRKECHRIRNDTFILFRNKTKTQNKLCKIEESIERLKYGSHQLRWISNFKELDEFKIALKNDEEFTQNRSYFFFNKDSKLKTRYQEDFGNRQGIFSKKNTTRITGTMDLSPEINLLSKRKSSAVKRIIVAPTIDNPYIVKQFK